MKRAVVVTGASGNTGRAVVVERSTTPAAKTDSISSAQDWFARGERIGYDPNARAIARGQGAPLSVFLKREGDPAHTVSFLPGFPDGSFGWAKVLPHLPNAAQMSKLFVEYVGMGDSDKPKDYCRPARRARASRPWREWRSGGYWFRSTRSS